MKNEIKKVTVTYNVTGHGLAPERIAEYAIRFKLPKYEFQYIRTKFPNEPEVEQIAELNGVEEVRIFERYAVIVKRATSYSWEELDPLISALLEQRHNRIVAETETQA